MELWAGAYYIGDFCVELGLLSLSVFFSVLFFFLLVLARRRGLESKTLIGAACVCGDERFWYALPVPSRILYFLD